MSNLSPVEIEKIAEIAAKRVAMDREEIRLVVSETIRQVFIQMGVAADDPLEMQKDFLHLRQWRKAGESAKSKIFLTVVSAFALFLAGLLGASFKAWLGG